MHDAVSEGFLSVLMMYRGAVVGSKRKLGNPPGIVGGLVGRMSSGTVLFVRECW